MKQTILICIAVAVAFLLLGRWSAPKAVDNQSEIKAHTALQKIWVDSARSANNRAEYWKERALKQQETKVVVRTIYKNEVTKINSLPDSVLGAALESRYKGRN